MMNKSWFREAIQSWFKKHSKKETSRLFCTPKWQDQAKLWYLLYRWFIFLTWLGISICSIFQFGSFDKKDKSYLWPIYLTNWDLTFGMVQAFLGAILVSKRWKLQKSQVDLDKFQSPDKLEKSYWYLNNATTTLALGATITYWAAVHDPKIHHVDPLNIMTHVFNSLLMLLDLFIVSVPFSVRNFCWCFAVTAFYVVFSVVYYVAGGLDRLGNHYIYKILDWEKPTRTFLVCVAVITFLFVLHCLLHLLSLLVNEVFAKYRGAENKNTHGISSQSNKHSVELGV